MTLILMLKGQSGSLTQTARRCSQQIESYEGDHLLDYINTISYLELGIHVSQVFHLFDNYRSPRPGTHAQSLL